MVRWIAGAVVAAFIGSLVFIAFVALTAPKANAADGTPWDRWNVAPYAASFAEACKKAPAAIDGFSLPASAREHFKKALGTDCAGGVEAWLTPGMALRQMWSGGQKPHVMNNKAVGELPVLKSPDGRRYHKNAVAETAKALKWTFVHEGKSYTLYLPFVCFNWSWADSPASVATVALLTPECRTVTVTVKPGDWVWYGVFSRRYLPASACWKVMDGENGSAPPTPCLNCDWKGVRDLIPAQYQPYHTTYYVAKSGQQTFSFPVEISEEYLQLCSLRDGVQSNGVLIKPHAWGERVHITIPPESFPTFDAGLVGREVEGKK